MGLKDLVDSGDNEQDSETSGLVGFWGIKGQYEKLQKDELCPNCGEDDTEKQSYYWRCNADDCETITYMRSNYRVNKDKMMGS